MKTIIYLLLLALVLNVVSLRRGRKELSPYCGFRTLEIRYCRRDWDCKYSDEYCGQMGYCVIDQSLYEDDPCGWDDEDEDLEEPGDGDGVPTNPCAAVLCPENTRCCNGRCIPIKEEKP